MQDPRFKLSTRTLEYARPEERTVALLARTSSSNQREQRTIETQMAELERQVAQAGVIVFERYLDDGVSGMRPMADRPAGRRAQ